MVALVCNRRLKYIFGFKKAAKDFEKTAKGLSLKHLLICIGISDVETN